MFMVERHNVIRGGMADAGAAFLWSGQNIDICTLDEHVL